MVLKKPQCIDSKVVERFDSIQLSLEGPIQSPFVYACRLQVPTDYVVELDKTLSDIEQRLFKVEKVLESLGPFKKTIHLIVRNDKPLTYHVTNRQIEIGKNLVKSEGHLERGLIKSWILQQKNDELREVTLSDEVMADFILYLVKGQLTIEDPLTRIQTKLGTALWPQVLKNNETYCDSAWKASEHYEICSHMNSNLISIDQEKVADLSVRPLLSSSLIIAYKKMSFSQQKTILNKWPEFLKSRYYSSDKAIEMLLKDPNPLRQGMRSIKNFSNYILASHIVDSSDFQQLYAQMTLELQNAGVSDSFAEAYFDYIFEIPDKLDTHSVFFKNLEKAALQNMNLQLAVKDKSNIWILPSKTYLPVVAFDKIKTRQTVYFACQNLKEIPVSDFFDKTEKLLLIKGCNQDISLNFVSILKTGVKDFIRLNNDIKFVQMHMPSLEMKQNELAHVNNYFDLVKNRDVNSPEFRTLGWTQIQWSDEYHAYKPKAVVEAIEYFRN